jgi:4-hydroxy-4-methyl-2-oxoglutarate aldolase
MYSIQPMPAQLDPSLVERLARVETATVGHVRSHGFMDPGIVPVLRGRHIAGTAVTILLPGPDASLLHHAMGFLRAGDVLVIDRCGDTRYACWGGILNHAAKRIGLTAVILDGPATDPAELRDQGIPIWSRGFSAVTTKPVTMGGCFNEPVSCGGVAVLPGDAIIADETGVLVIRASEAATIAEAGLARQEHEKLLVGRILAGEPVDEVSGAATRIKAALAAAAKRPT